MQTNILVVFANPRGTDPMRLGSEDRTILESIRLGRYRDRISLTRIHAATIHDLRRALLDNAFQVVHISSHGTGMGLVLEDELGGKYVVPQQALAELLQAYSPPIDCVILNACYSVTQGQLMSMGVPFTIVMEGPISDKAAIEFSRGFYDSLGAAKTLDFAYEEGCRTVKLAAPGAEFVSKLLRKGETYTSSFGQPPTPRYEIYEGKVIDLLPAHNPVAGEWRVIQDDASRFAYQLDKQSVERQQGYVENYELSLFST